MDNQALAKEILKNVGTESNVESLVHCVTRLRFKLIDTEKADKGTIENLEGVLSVVESGGQFQVVIGNKVEDIYKEIMSLAKNLNLGNEVKEGTKIVKEKASLSSRTLDLISSILEPVLSILASVSLLKAVLVILVHYNYMSTSSGAYEVLHVIEDGALYFMPILIALTSAKKFGANEFVSGTLGAILIHPEIINYFNTSDIHTFLGIQIKAVNYSFTFVPIIISVWLLAKLEKFLHKIINASLKHFFMPLACLIIVTPVMFIIVGPVSTVITNSVGVIYEHIYDFNPILFGALVGGLWQTLVIKGIHWGAMPVVINNLSLRGVDTFMALAISGGVGQAGAVLGVILKTKNNNIRKAAIATIPTGFLGITEPTIYGVTLKHKTPFICGSIGGAVGGAIAGYSGSAAMGYVIPGFLTLPVYFGKGFSILLIAVITAYIIGAIISFITFKDQIEKLHTISFEENISLKEASVNEAEGYLQKEEIKQSGEEFLKSPLKGKLIELSKVSDKVFAEEVLGKGIAIIPSEGRLLSPVDGTVSVVFPTGHAVAVTSDDGVEILMHIGFNTVSLEGRYFNTQVTQGQVVKKGEVLVEFEIDNIKNQGFDITTPIVITNSDNYSVVEGVNLQVVDFNDNILRIKR